MTKSDPSRRAICSCVAAGWLVTVVLGLLSNGVHHDDDLVHFLMARWSWWYPEYLLNVWGRPGMTLPLAAVSWPRDVEIAWHVARLLSATVSAAAAFIAARLAARMGIERPWRVALLCYLQPLFTVLGFTTLTENFTALYLIGAVSLLHARRAALASCVFSMALLTRHEAVVFVPLWCWVIFRDRATMKRPLLAAILCLWAPIAHNLFSAAIQGYWPATLFFHPSGSTQYRPTAWGAYVPDAVYATTLPIFLLAGAGAAHLHRVVRPGLDNDHRSSRGTTFLIVAIPLLFFLLHAAFKALGVYASGGFARFMVAVAPFTAICAAAGIHVLWGRDSNWRRRGALLAAAITIIIWAAVISETYAGRRVLPIPQFLSDMNGSARTIIDAAPHVLAAMLVGSLVFLGSVRKPRGR
ncbi:MAG TPA: hypothetical protein VNT79_15290, partial [Phycisphaerae bacterium]|nr:hypothetical protein [Phycisphaerae bacterium]